MCPGALVRSFRVAAGAETGLGVVAGGGGLQRNTSSSEKARAEPDCLFGSHRKRTDPNPDLQVSRNAS